MNFIRWMKKQCDVLCKYAFDQMALKKISLSLFLAFVSQIFRMCNVRRDSFFIFLTANNSNHIKFVAVTVAVTIAITIANADVVVVASFSSSS